MECQVRDVTVHFEQAGAGRPLIALHGWPLDHRHMFHDLEPTFGERQGWRRIYPDLPGMGLTGGPDWLTHQDQMLDVVLEFIDSVAPGERFAIAGTSYGGYLARGVVYRRAKQMDGLLLVVPSMKRFETRANLPPRQVLREDPEYLAALGPDEQDLHDWIVAQSMEVLQAVRKVISPAVALADNDFLDRLNKSYSFSFDLDSLSEPFRAPSLFLMGRQDNWCGYDDAYQILNSYPRATYAVLDRAGHGLGLEQKALFRALVSEWLDRVEEYAGQHH